MGTKITLVLFGIIVIVFGFLEFFKIGKVSYYAIAEVVLGLIAAIIGLMAKKPQS